MEDNDSVDSTFYNSKYNSLKSNNYKNQSIFNEKLLFMAYINNENNNNNLSINKDNDGVLFNSKSSSIHKSIIKNSKNKANYNYSELNINNISKISNFTNCINNENNNDNNSFYEELNSIEASEIAFSIIDDLNLSKSDSFDDSLNVIDLSKNL